MLGTIGHLLILIAFVACLGTGYAFFKATNNPAGAAPWIRLGRLGWGTMFAGIIGAMLVLSYLIWTHQYGYNYVWSNSSNDLPMHYIFSALWAGQEGSFLLWIFFTGLTGLGVIYWGRSFEAPVMTVIAFCQAFMISMIVGIKLGFLPIGSNPFMLLAERFPDAPFLQSGGVPPDGNGLNDLLQNPWMVIHPPTLFIGFATMIVPFAYAVAGLWTRRYTEWVRPALPWAIMANMILAGGIIMGGYWAYVTLSFGGYWAWDPVENSSLVPWLVGIAAIHTMIAQKRSGTSQKAAIWLSILAYMLVIYSTFLTRSGILGDISVHSFVDLGLNNQLLVWILAMAAVGFGLFFYRYKELPTPRQEPNFLSREFMIFTGAMLLCALALVIILGTSTPILGRIFRDNPSGVPIEFYNKWSLPIIVIIAFLLGLGQLFWWSKMSVEKVNQVLLRPLVAAVVGTIIVLFVTPFAQTTAKAPVAAVGADPTLYHSGIAASLGAFWAQYGTSLLFLLLVFASFFAFFGNLQVAWRIGRGQPKLAGGALAHLGFAMMLFGIISTTGFNNPLTDTGEPIQRDNFIINRGQTVAIEGYEVTYSGQSRTPEGYASYQLDFKDPENRTFTLNPVVYKSRRDQWIQHPDLKNYFEKDIYVAVSPSVMYEERTGANKTPGELEIQQGQTTNLGTSPYSITFEKFDLEVDPALKTENVDIAVAAAIQVANRNSGETKSLKPVYLVDKDRSQRFESVEIPEWGLTITFAGMQVDSGSARLVIQGVDFDAEDWLVVQAYEKPVINLLWYGCFLMLAGFGVAMFRRIEEQHEHERRGLA